MGGMWKTIHAIREGKIERRYESVHQDMAIEEISGLTCQPKENAPAVAEPRMGGALGFWHDSLTSLQGMLE